MSKQHEKTDEWNLLITVISLGDDQDQTESSITFLSTCKKKTFFLLLERI